MAGVNKAIIVGNLGNDPEIRYSANGNAIASISVATSDRWKDKTTGEQQERTEWHRVKLFGRLAELAGEYLKKGSQVYVDGRLKMNQWKDAKGNYHQKYFIIGENIRFLKGNIEETSHNSNITNTKQPVVEEIVDEFDEVPF